jgi:uncharacterized protein YkwD
MIPRRIAFILFLSALAIYPACTQSGQASGPREIWAMINQERARAGVARLEWNEHLADSALAHVRRMVEQGQLSHQLFQEPDLGDRIRATGIRFDAWGENVALAGNVDEIHRALMNSPPHRANILDTKYNSVGIAILPRGRDLYAVENFANVYSPISESQFRDTLVAAFNEARKAHRGAPVEVKTDSRLTEAACSGDSDINRLLRNQPGALTLVVFTASSPDKMSPDMLSAAGDSKLRRMNLGVCFRPGKDQGFSSFRVVAAFYPAVRY